MDERSALASRMRRFGFATWTGAAIVFAVVARLTFAAPKPESPCQAEICVPVISEAAAIEMLIFLAWFVGLVLIALTAWFVVWLRYDLPYQRELRALVKERDARARRF